MNIEHRPEADVSAAHIPLISAWTRAALRDTGENYGWNCERGDKRLNWLAFGLLLAAWNFSDNDAVVMRAGRPAELANHALVTVRAAREHAI